MPQSVTNKDGQPQDIDIVINEILSDGDEVYVEYSNGPMPYRVRCEAGIVMCMEGVAAAARRYGTAARLCPGTHAWLHA